MSLGAAPSSLSSGARTLSIGGGWGSCSRRERAGADARRRRLQRRDQVGPERRRMVVGLGRATARRRTGRPAGAAASHSASEGRLAEAGRRGDRASASTRCPRPRRSLSRGRGDQAAPQPGDVELGLEQRAGVLRRCHRCGGPSRVVAATRRTQLLRDGLDGLAGGRRVGVALHEGLDLVARSRRRSPAPRAS